MIGNEIEWRGAETVPLAERFNSGTETVSAFQGEIDNGALICSEIEAEKVERLVRKIFIARPRRG